MTEDAKKRCEELARKYATHTVDSRVDIVLYAAYQDAYQAGYNDPDRAKIVATKSGSHIMVAKELWEQERNANKELLDECENVLLQAWGELEAGCKASEMCFELIDKLKAARGGDERSRGVK